MRVQFREIQGLRTRILYEGSGYPVLFVHGLGTMAERWIRNIDVLGREFRVLAPDLLNHGFTANVVFGGRPPQLRHADHLRAMLDELGVERCAVVGSSYGGLLAALLALREPSRVDRLIIVGSGSALHPPDRQRHVFEAVKKNAMTAVTDGTLDGCRTRLRNTAFDPMTVPEETLPLLLTANASPGRPAALEDLYDSLIACTGVPEALTYHRLERISVPTLLLTGRDDIRASWEMAEAAQRRIADCRLRIFERCGHGPMVEHPEAFNNEVLAFLRPLRNADAAEVANALGDVQGG